MCVLDFCIDVFLEVQNERYSPMLYLIDYYRQAHAASDAVCEAHLLSVRETSALYSTFAMGDHPPA